MNELPEVWEKAIRNLCEECADVEDFLDTAKAIWDEAHRLFYEMGYNDRKNHKVNVPDLLIEDMIDEFGKGYEAGYKRGHSEGRDQGYRAGYDMGYTEGHKKGFDRGYDQGYKQCFEEHK